MTVTQLYPNSDANEVLERNKGKFESVFLFGWDHDGELRIDTNDNWTPMDILWALENTKQHLLTIGVEYEDDL